MSRLRILIGTFVALAIVFFFNILPIESVAIWLVGSAHGMFWHWITGDRK